MAIVAVVVVLLALLVVDPSLVAPHTADETAKRSPEDVRLVTPSSESDAKLWPFTSRRKSFESLTLPVNAVVQGDSSRVRSQLRYQQDGQWEQMRNDWQGIDSEGERVVVSGGDVTWRETTGATRYIYVSAPGSEGGWTTETVQLHDGTYFGSRYHLRLYEGGTGSGTWTAIQAHHEHWDWFRLRHTVGSVATAQHHLETEYFGTSYTADVTRKRYANGGISDADGWVSIVDLRPLSAVGGLSAGLLLFGSFVGQQTWQTTVEQAMTWLSDELRQRSALLFACLLSLPVAVRSGSILAETTVAALPIKLVAGTFYLVLAVGIPVVAFVFPRGGEPLDWAGLAVLGLGLGFVLDYQSIGIEVLPIAVVLHRVAVLAVVGFLAASASQRTAEESWNRSLTIGLTMWLCVLVWPLLVGL
jgi:hypothetical protein